MTKPSYGKGALGRIYERLRKRSYRKYMFSLRRTVHTAYVRGVKDALDEVRKEGLVQQ